MSSAFVIPKKIELKNKNGFLFCIVFDLDKNLMLGKENILSFLSLNRFFALSLDKIGGISTIKIQIWRFLFCIVFDLNKNLSLRKVNKLSFPSLNRFFALSLHKKQEKDSWKSKVQHSASARPQ